MNRLPEDEELSGRQLNERAQLLHSLKATPAQRLAWLEEMLVGASLHRRLAPQAREAGGVPASEG